LRSAREEQDNTMKELTHFINGFALKGASGRFGDVFNPATGEVQARAPLASRAEVRRAVESAAKAFPEWASVNPQRRARVLFNFKTLIERHMDELAAMLEERLRSRGERLRAYDAERERKALRDRIRRFVIRDR